MDTPHPIPDGLRNHLGEALDSAWTPAAAPGSPIVVIAHGVTSHHDRPWLVALSEALAERGISSLRISYAGNGRSEGRYQESTISKEVEELRTVVQALADAGTPTLAYAGHSMGGAVGVRAVAQHDLPVQCLVSLAGMIEVQAFVTRHFGDLTPGKDVLLGKSHCPYSQEYLDDCLAIGDVLADAARITRPWLLIHGDADELVPLAESEAAARATEHAQLISMAGIDHRFTGAEAEMAEAVAQWLARQSRAGLASGGS